MAGSSQSILSITTGYLKKERENEWILNFERRKNVVLLNSDCRSVLGQNEFWNLQLPGVPHCGRREKSAGGKNCCFLWVFYFIDYLTDLWCFQALKDQEEKNEEDMAEKIKASFKKSAAEKNSGVTT